MANIWRNRIWAGTKTFAECPARYKADVEALMRQDVADGKHTAREFEEKTGIPYVTTEEINAMKSAELKETAKAYGIEGYESMTVAELKQALKER